MPNLPLNKYASSFLAASILTASLSGPAFADEKQKQTVFGERGPTVADFVEMSADQRAKVVTQEAKRFYQAFLNKGNNESAKCILEYHNNRSDEGFVRMFLGTISMVRNKFNPEKVYINHIVELIFMKKCKIEYGK
ncbi:MULTISPECIES: hypothetical protein [unclassified Nitrospina]|uniref:hypothetical protein n=1 Tax=unclassified Nitrospina TaxID=2638683 RepID=UPI003F978373